MRLFVLAPDLKRRRGDASLLWRFDENNFVFSRKKLSQKIDKSKKHYVSNGFISDANVLSVRGAPGFLQL
jgi:hypothetical protein